MKRKITIIALALAMIATMSVSAFAGSGTQITSVTIPTKISPEKVNPDDDYSKTTSYTEDKYTVEPTGAELSAVASGWIMELTDDEIEKFNKSEVIEFDGRKWAGIICASDDGHLGAEYKKLHAGRRYGYAVQYVASSDSYFAEDKSKTVISIGGKIISDNRKLYDSFYGLTEMVVYLDFGTLQEDGTFTGGDFSETKTTNGANTADSSNIALYSFTALLALAGIGIVGYKKREN